MNDSKVTLRNSDKVQKAMEKGKQRNPSNSKSQVGANQGQKPLKDYDDNKDIIIAATKAPFGEDHQDTA